jgi:N-acetyl-alpha-D-muramate 1-phosphate uridylyltransferase
MKGFLLAAGLGTRLKPWTDHHPKSLAIVNNKSLLQRNIEYLLSFDIKEIIINVHHFAEQIITAIEKNNGFGAKVTISDETDAVLETGGGLQKAAWYFTSNEDFVLMNCDVLTDMHLPAIIQQHQNTDALATLAVTQRVSSRYFLFDDAMHLSGWKNTNTGEEKIMRQALSLQPKAFSGIHVINNKIFPLITQEGKFSMVDVYLSLCNEHNILAFDHSDSKFLDVGKPESIAKAEALFP